MGFCQCFVFSAKGRSADPNAFFFAVGDVFPVAVDFICDDGFWITAVALEVSLHCQDQVGAFIKVVPTDSLGVGVAVYQADGDFGAKFSGLVDFPSDDGANMRLMKADDPIVDAVSALFIHGLLLLIQCS